MQNVWQPVMKARPSTSGITAACGPNVVVSMRRTVNRLPMMLSITRGSVDLTARVVEGGAGAHARPGGAAVHLALGKDTHVAAMRALALRRPDEDRPVEKVQVFLERMLDRPVGYHGALDSPALLDQRAKVLRRASKADVGGLDVGIKSSAEGQVVAHRTEPRRLHRLIERHDERRDVVEIDADDVCVLHAGVGRHQPGGRVDPHAGLGGVQGQHHYH